MTWDLFNLPIVPHERAGIECCGCLYPIARGNLADMTCNECGVVAFTLPAADVESVMIRMAIEGGVCIPVCSHCAAVNVILGFCSADAFICKECGEANVVREDVQ